MKLRTAHPRARAAAVLVAGLVLVGVAAAAHARRGAAAPDAATPAVFTRAATPDPEPGDPSAAAATAPREPSPSRVVSTSFTSRALRRAMPYLVYLPPGYDSSPAARYPVLYMLHGMGGTLTEWQGYGIFDMADRLITAGQIPPFMIVLPQGDTDYWVDHAGGGPRWGLYTARDVVEEIDGRYRTLAERGHRAIGGLSMGAHGALQLAMNYPGTFGVVGAHSPTLRRRDTMPAYFGDQAYFNAHDPVYLLQQHPEAARAVTLWLDVGAEDIWAPVVEEFHQQLADAGVAHVFHVFPGGHASEFWAGNVAAYLAFYGAALGGPPLR